MRPGKESLVYNHVKPEDLERVAKELIGFSGKHRVYAIYGEMGSGKTTFIKAVGKVVGVKDTMSSPTFALVNEYALNEGGRLVHFDFYRIASEREAAALGVDEYFESGDYCFVEWPERIPNLLPENHVDVHLTVQADDQRQVEISIHGR